MLKLNSDVSVGEVDGRLIVVNLQTGFYYSLNETAAFIVKLIREGRSDEEILLEVCAMYDVPEETARRDCEECIASLVKECVLIQPGA